MSETVLSCTIRHEDVPVIQASIAAWKVEQACAIECTSPQERLFLGRVALRVGVRLLIERIEGAKDAVRALGGDASALKKSVEATVLAAHAGKPERMSRGRSK